MIEDLSTAAIKVARRLQALPKGYIHAVILVKDEYGNWQLSVQSSTKLEKMTEGQ